MYAYRNYLVMVSPPFTPSAGATSATIRNFVAKSSDPNTDISKVVVFDLENKFVAYSGTYTDGIREIFSSDGQIYLLSNDGKVRPLHHPPQPQLTDPQAASSRRETDCGQTRVALPQVAVPHCAEHGQDPGTG